MTKPTAYYKVLSSDGSAYHGGSGKWHLPSGKRPGKWMPKITGDLEPCKNGYHLCREQDLVRWLGETIYEAEYRGEIVECEDKVVVREARLIRKLKTWTLQTSTLFACDCSSRVLKHFEAEYPYDKRPRKSIETARRWAEGRATDEELSAARDAARAAAWAAAKDAAWAAARDAAWAAAGAAAKDAAWAAARDAAWDAARGAARGAETRWQAKRLMKYLRGEQP